MRPITDVLRDYRNGRAVDMASRDLAECVRAVDETGKKAKLVIELTIEPEKGGGSQKELSIKVKSSVPKADIPKAIFFSDGTGDLHRTDPQQKEMFTEAGGAARGSA
ncbi:hypothetical protein ACE10Z_23490 [Bradyrhizobium sp. Pha-3]|uniref:hypothetical protein n=1 Tax=Bradyrhizobium sp. Pha-3 TaxID=208375 RepID=UPI0035D49496